MKLTKQTIFIVIIFILSFAYISFNTIDVPIFFEGRLFLTELIKYPLIYWMKEVLSLGSNNPLGSTGELNGLLAWILNLLFGYNENAYRFIKALFFAGTITFIYILASKIMKNKFAILSTAIILFSFPHFIHTFIFDEPFIYAELFKIAAIILIIKDNTCKNWKNSVGIFFLSFISFRFYHPAASIFGLLILLTLVQKRFRYLFVIIALLLFISPRNLPNAGLTTPEYAPKLNILSAMFIQGFKETILNPIPRLDGLYHRPFWDVLTISGILLLFLTIMAILIYRVRINTHTTQLLCFWIISELPLFIFLPEPAIRYTSGMLTPFILLMFYVINILMNAIKKEYHKPTIIMIIILIVFMILTNLAYTTVFRATWGSGFIAAGKTIKYLQEKNENLTVYYAAMQVAPDFIPINTKTKPYSIDTTIRFKYFKPEIPINSNSYIIQRVTSTGKKYPETVQDIKETEIIGVQENNIFDLIMNVPRRLINIPPNKMIIYKSI